MFFEKLGDFLAGREHRFVRDYLFLSGAVLIGATMLGAYLSRHVVEVDTMPVASIGDKAGQKGVKTYNLVRSVLDPSGGTTRVDTVPADTAVPDTIVTGGIAAGLRSVRIDPCTGETK